MLTKELIRMGGVEVVYINSGVSGNYDVSTGVISINSKNIYDRDKNKLNTRLFSTLMHELVHKFAHFEGKNSGFEINRKNVDINEGMTELIKDKIYVEYINRSGSRSDVLLSDTKAPLIRKTYIQERQDLVEKIKQMAIKMSVDYNTAFYAVTSAYFRGDFKELEDALA